MSEHPSFLIIRGTNIQFDRLAGPENSYRTALDRSGLYERHGGQFLVARRPTEVLEGDYPDNMLTLIAQFPTLGDAEAFWDSPDYQAIKPLREGAGDFTIGLWKRLPNVQSVGAVEKMAVMVIVARNITGDGYGRYVKALQDQKLLEAHDAVPLAGGKPHRLLEGEFPADHNTVLIRFPSLEKIREFWNSSEYKEIKKIREGAADISVAVWEREFQL